MSDLVAESVETLAEAIRAVTDLWDEPLDEVRDVPQIVNALIASGVVRPADEVRAEVWDEGHRAGIHGHRAQIEAGRRDAYKPRNPYRAALAEGGRDRG